MQEEKRYLTPAEVSARFCHRVTTGTLANWRSSGAAGPAFIKIGGRILYSVSSLEEWERRRTSNGTAEYGKLK